jgi:hypothetical protein
MFNATSCAWASASLAWHPSMLPSSSLMTAHSLDAGH